MAVNAEGSTRVLWVRDTLGIEDHVRYRWQTQCCLRMRIQDFKILQRRCKKITSYQDIYNAWEKASRVNKCLVVDMDAPNESQVYYYYDVPFPTLLKDTRKCLINTMTTTITTTTTTIYGILSIAAMMTVWTVSGRFRTSTS